MADAAGPAERYTGELRKYYGQLPENRPPRSRTSGNRPFRSQLTRRGRHDERESGAVVALVAIVDTPQGHYFGVCFSALYRDRIVATVDRQQLPLGKIAQPQRVEQVFSVRLVARFSQGKSEKSACLESAIEFVDEADQFVIVVTAVLTPALRNHDPTVEPRGQLEGYSEFIWLVLIPTLALSHTVFTGAATVLHNGAKVNKTGNASKPECRRAGSPASRSLAAAKNSARFRNGVGDEIVLHALINEGAFSAQPGPCPGAQLALTTAPAIHAGMAGERARATAVSSDEMLLSGDELLGKKFAVCFRV